MTKAFTIAIVLFAFLSGSVLCAQVEMLRNLRSNPVISNQWAGFTKHDILPTSSLLGNDTLPFLDDFSKPGPYPDPTKWGNESVYVNRGFGIAPPSIGVATFDGLDSTGKPYNPVASLTVVTQCDNLTSRPINLGYNKTVFDSSIYLSFYYQRQGNGVSPNEPTVADSITLEFKSPGSATWDWQWTRVGYNPVSPDTGFHLVMIQIKDSVYLLNGFQFRFINFACPCGNTDQWNIDYVYLNKGRSAGDTIFHDVAFAYNPSSLLKTYQAMPWRQYNKSEIRDSLTTWIRNNDTIVTNASYGYTIDSALKQITTYPLQADNVLPFDSANGYCKYIPFCKPGIKDTIPLLTDSVVYTWKSYLKTNFNDFDKWNDTVRFSQKFLNYYAYDDGTAEQGYYLNSTSDFPALAMRFKLNVADTLKSINIFFDPFVYQGTLSSLYPFRIEAWQDSSGFPGKLIYEDSTENYPDYIPGGYNMFAQYHLSDSMYILQPGIYYIGIVQDNSATGPNTNPMLIGFDMNTNSSANTYYKNDGLWYQSGLSGTVMMRAEFGHNSAVNTGIKPLQAPLVNFDIYPNPAALTITVKLNTSDLSKRFELSVIDDHGNTIRIENNFTGPTIDISALSQGLYFIKLSDQYANSATRRVLVIR
jgi:hypothetical protein